MSLSKLSDHVQDLSFILCVRFVHLLHYVLMLSDRDTFIRHRKTVVLELGAFSIAVVDLFADSMSTLFPAKSSAFFKILAFFM